jgi:hypothetical protein
MLSPRSGPSGIGTRLSRLSEGAAFGPAGAGRPGVFDVMMFKTLSSDESSQSGSSFLERARDVEKQDDKGYQFRTI